MQIMQALAHAQTHDHALILRERTPTKILATSHSVNLVLHERIRCYYAGFSIILVMTIELYTKGVYNSMVMTTSGGRRVSISIICMHAASSAQRIILLLPT